MKYPKIVTFRLFGYTFDIMLDNVKSRNLRAEEIVKDLENWSANLGELDPIDESELSDYTPVYPSKPIKKVTKKPVKPTKKAPRKR